MPNKHQATDFYQIKIELHKQSRLYGTNVTGFFLGGGGGGGVSSYRYQRPVFVAQMLFFINARISKLESNCDEANRQHLPNNGRYHS